MENVWIVTMIIVYPARPGVVGWLASLFTTGKYLMGCPSQCCCSSGWSGQPCPLPD